MIGNNKNNGFTLIEALVSVAIFSIAITVIATVFFNTNNLQQRTKNLQQLQNEGRYILDKLAKEIRAREIDPALTGDNQELFFKADEFGEMLGFYYDEDQQNLMISSQTGEQDALSAPLNSSAIAVSDIEFFIFPTTNEEAELRQPMVLIRLVLKNRINSKLYYQELRLQTAISSKFYK